MPGSQALGTKINLQCDLKIAPSWRDCLDKGGPKDKAVKDGKALPGEVRPKNYPSYNEEMWVLSHSPCEPIHLCDPVANFTFSQQGNQKVHLLPFWSSGNNRSEHFGVCLKYFTGRRQQVFMCEDGSWEDNPSEMLLAWFGPLNPCQLWPAFYQVSDVSPWSVTQLQENDLNWREHLALCSTK